MRLRRQAKIGTYSQRLRESERNVTKSNLFQTNIFFLKNHFATLYMARNLLAFSSHNEILDLYYKGTIILAQPGFEPGTLSMVAHNANHHTTRASYKEIK